MSRSAVRRKNGHKAAAPSVEAMVDKIIPAAGAPPEERPWWNRLGRWLVGAPRSLWDRSLFHKVALIPVLAWVGMGADGLSSSAYGPEEAFKALGRHTYLVPFIVFAVVGTIAIVSMAYKRIIEHFPSGGGGYVVASALLGPAAGLVSGSALLVDYVLTVTVSIAAGGDALLSLAPPSWARAKLAVDLAVLAVLGVLNLRGLKESVIAVAPVFFLFVVSHVILILVSLGLHNGDFARVTWAAIDGNVHGVETIGLLGLGVILVRAYSMGAGTFTGIEAVSNSVGMLREPKVESGKRTMTYMGLSLGALAGCLLIGYLYAEVAPAEGRTLNAVLAEDAFGPRFAGMPGLGPVLLWITLLTEAGLLFIAAQTGFIGGPQVMANMALDGWLPRRFSMLSSRLTMQNGVLLVAVGGLASLLYTRGDTHLLVLMYSINVFITFCLSMLSMAVLAWRARNTGGSWKREFATHVLGLSLCSTILALMIWQKFALGGWVTLVSTAALAALCIWCRGYYRTVRARLKRLDDQLLSLPISGKPTARGLDPSKPTAIVLVERFSGVGIHAVFSILKSFPGTFKNVVFVSVGVVDTGNFKGAAALDELRTHVESELKRYVEFARRLGLPAEYDLSVGTDVVAEAADLCGRVAKRFRSAVVFGAQLIFQQERWYHAMMHNRTAAAIQARLQWAGLTMTILPIRVFG